MASFLTKPSELDQFDFDLPRELIAQEPMRNRSDSRMMVIDRKNQTIEHARVRDLPEFLNRGDTLVVNDSKVIPARLVGSRTLTQGRWEGLFLRQGEGAESMLGELLCKTRGKMALGETVSLRDREGRDAGELTLMAHGDEGKMVFKPTSEEPWIELLERCGRVPLPPYIRDGQMVDSDVQRYQTVYARSAGSVAAPTAGLHFTPELIHRVRDAGCSLVSLTLHVGIGTFRPIQVDKIADHKMHSERGEISEAVVKKLNATRRESGRIIAVGTTSVRVLETAGKATLDELQGTGEAKPESVARPIELKAWRGETDIFIHPGHEFLATDGMLTNFHLPKSSLIVMVSAFAGLDLVRRAYREAIEEKYRFYSYGDCMLIL